MIGSFLCTWWKYALFVRFLCWSFGIRPTALFPSSVILCVLTCMTAILINIITSHGFCVICLVWVEFLHFFPLLQYVSVLFLMKWIHRTRRLQLPLWEVSEFQAINLCNALFIAFLCNYSVIGLSTVQLLVVNGVLHRIAPFVCQVFTTLNVCCQTFMSL